MNLLETFEFFLGIGGIAQGNHAIVFLPTYKWRNIR
jgi:hypothetical protein